ncbi:MAG: cation:proton antiporter [Gemmatimonadales bacterium]
MHDFEILRDLLILVAVAVPAVAIGQRLRLHSVVGLLLAGMATGPHGLGLIENPELLAELGAVLLLFEIGLEVSLSKIFRMGRAVFVGGSLQMTLVIAAVALLGPLLGLGWNAAIAMGCLVALSSTAVVLKVFGDRDELDTPHGRVVLSILLFQDLAVVPLMLLLPLLGEGAGSLAEVTRGLLLATTVLVILVGGGRLLVPILLERVVGLKNRELFTLTVGFIGLGAAYITAEVGLSLALGAFLAGLIISESQYGMQALSDVLPFRILFSSVFFASVGMLLDLGFVADNAAMVLGLTAALILGKALLATIATMTLGMSLFTAILTGLGLAQVGEFSFVLATVAQSSGLVSGEHYQWFLAATAISLVAAPILINVSRAIAEPVARKLGRHVPQSDRSPKVTVAGQSNHAILVGFGLAGKNLARVLKAAHLPYVALEMNGPVVRRARQDHEPVYFGDGTRREVLRHVGIEHARVIVFSIASPSDELRGVAIARQMNPTIKILVRTRYVRSIKELERLGADEVIVEEFEAALELFERVLTIYTIPANIIRTELDAVRTAQYGLLRGVPKSDLGLADLRFIGISHALRLVRVEESSRATGRDPVGLDIRRTTGATVVAVVRDGRALHTPDPEFRFRAGDTVVLVGEAPALDRGEELFVSTTITSD